MVVPGSVGASSKETGSGFGPPQIITLASWERCGISFFPLTSFSFYYFFFCFLLHYLFFSTLPWNGVWTNCPELSSQFEFRTQDRVWYVSVYLACAFLCARVERYVIFFLRILPFFVLLRGKMVCDLIENWLKLCSAVWLNIASVVVGS